MNKLLLLQGLPASGKSTYAKKLLNEGKDFVRVNRDELRQTLHNGKWSQNNEAVIVEAEKNIAKAILDSGKNVVVDDTGFGKQEKLWKEFCRDRGIEFEKKFFDVSLEECIHRDYIRAEQGLPSVGGNVIRKMALRNGLVNWPNKPIVLCDIDGTLAEGSHRQHFVRKEPKDWNSYLAELPYDTPIEPIFRWVKALSEDHVIVIVSGRGAEHEYQTLDWFERVWQPRPLFRHLEIPRFPVFTWLFRDKGDRRPDDIVKLEFLKLLPRDPVLVIDDRPSVVRAWKSKGLKVINVAGACEEF